MIYNWQNTNWANLTYNHLSISDIISCFVEFSDEMKVVLQKKTLQNNMEKPKQTDSMLGIGSAYARRSVIKI
jgi:hypothetical protein